MNSGVGDIMEEQTEEKKAEVQWLPCPICQALFIEKKYISKLYTPVRVTNQEALKAHYKDRPWELLIEYANNGEQKTLKCSYCKRVFLGVETFANHVEEYPECYNFAIEQILFRFGKEKEEFIKYDYRPGERDVIMQSIQYDRIKKQKLYPWDGEVDYGPGTSIIMDEIKWGPRHYAATILGFAGIPGSGKSTLAITLGFHHRTIWLPYVQKMRPNATLDCAGAKVCGTYCPRCPYFREDAKDPNRKCNGIKIAVFFNVSDALTILEYLTYGDLLLIDEMPLMVGEGSSTRIKQLKTILNVLRKGAISWFFVNPSPQKYITTYNLILEVVAKNMARDRKFDETVGVTYNRKVAPIGWFRCKVISNTSNPIYQEFLKLYEEDKDKNIDQLKAQEGAESGSVGLPELDRNIPKIYNFMVEYGLSYRDPSGVKQSDVLFIIRRHFDGPTQLLKDLALHFVKMVNQDPSKFDLLWEGSPTRGKKPPEIHESGDYEFVLTEGGRQVGGKEMYADIEKYLEEAEKISPTKSNKYQHRCAEAFFMIYRDGYTYDAAGIDLGKKYKGEKVSGATLANKLAKGGWVARFTEEILGTLMELYHLSLLKSSDIKFIRKGGIGETDLIQPEKDIGVEVKARTRQIDVPESRWADEYLTEESRDRVRRGGVQFLVTYLFDSGTVEISQYRVSLKEQKKPQLVDIEKEEDE
jgi:hypothetical protein